MNQPVSRPWTLLFAAALCSLGSCSSKQDESAAQGSGVLPAVMLSTLVRTPGDSTLYIGPFRELPKGEVDLSGMIEVIGGNIGRIR